MQVFMSDGCITLNTLVLLYDASCCVGAGFSLPNTHTVCHLFLFLAACESVNHEFKLWHLLLNSLNRSQAKQNL